MGEVSTTEELSLPRSDPRRQRNEDTGHHMAPHGTSQRRSSPLGKSTPQHNSPLDHYTNGYRLKGATIQTQHHRKQGQAKDNVRLEACTPLARVDEGKDRPYAVFVAVTVAYLESPAPFHSTPQ